MQVSPSAIPKSTKVRCLCAGLPVRYPKEYEGRVMCAGLPVRCPKEYEGRVMCAGLPVRCPKEYEGRVMCAGLPVRCPKKYEGKVSVCRSCPPALSQNVTKVTLEFCLSTVSQNTIKKNTKPVWSVHQPCTVCPPTQCGSVHQASTVCPPSQCSLSTSPVWFVY